jgi:polar amino acid transport system substrate-binding protein
MNATVRSGGWAWGLLTAATAHAGCSRPIEVPMAPVGLSVTFDGERAGGLYPTLMRELGKAIDCQFQFQRVPRARLQKMFESGQADVMLPAAQAPSRDAHGEFVPIVQVRVSLVTLTRELPPPRSLAELLSKRSYKVAVVRGFTFGPAYDQALATLHAQHRLVEEPDSAGVARALRQGLAQVTIMTAHIFLGTLKQEPDLQPLVGQVLVEPLAELGWAESGLYLSRQLSDADRHTLRTAVRQAVRSGRVWQMLTDTYPAGSLNSSVRPLPP